MTEKEMDLRRIREYNHPAGSPCPMCNGSGHMMVIYARLLVACPCCNYFGTNNTSNWWKDALPEVQQEYDQAVRGHTTGGTA